jgi:expansin (peptidoglycan-binding protein)
MRFENVPTSHVLIAVGALGLAACSDSNPPEIPVDPLSEEKTSVAIRVASDGTGNCNFPINQNDLLVIALDPAAYAAAAMCGACAEMELPDQKKKVRVRVVDSCSGCAPEQLGVSPQVFDALGGSDLLQANVRWRFITCPVEGPIRYHIKDGSSAYWVAIQVRNHRLPIRKLEWEKDGTWHEVKRESYNYFVQENLGPGPVHVRVTAHNGKTLEDTLPYIQGNTDIDGAAQFED